MARSRLAAAALLLLAGFAGGARAADLCEGCWEVGGHAAYLLPSARSGTDSAVGVGAEGRFRFRPFWSVAFALDTFETRITDGPDESIRFFSISFEYTLRATREQRSRPFIAFTTGLAFDHVSSGATRVKTSTGSTFVGRSLPEGDHGITYGIGIGGLTTLTDRLYLRYEGRLVRWSTFGIASSSNEIVVGLTLRLGR